MKILLFEKNQLSTICFYVIFILSFALPELRLGLPGESNYRFITTILFFVIFLMLFVINAKRNINHKKIQYLIIFYFSAPAICFFLSDNPFSPQSLQKILFGLAVFCCHIFFINQLLKNFALKNLFFVAFVINLFFVSTSMMVIIGVLPPDPIFPNTGIFKNANGLSIACFGTLSGAIYFYLKSKKNIYFIIILINIYLIFIGSGRGTIVGAIISFLIIILMNYNLSIKFYTFYLPGIIFIFIIFVYFIDFKLFVLKLLLESSSDLRVKSIIENDKLLDAVFYSRLGNNLIPEFLRDIESRIYFGSGFGLTLVENIGFTSYKFKGIEKGSSLVTAIDEMGLTGVFFYMCIMVLNFSTIGFNKKYAYNDNFRSFFFPLGLISFGLIIESLISSWFYSPGSSSFNYYLYNAIGLYFIMSNSKYFSIEKISHNY